ncbi:tripartite motif-containing protein 16 [Siphateles boraxobius]|uniref:tripartite motif-containing protein 16 n=1 Tax=Siphateles boraxobius TaxID=180520 RepID=UPI004064911F
MAEASISVDQFSCPVCLDLLKDPVTIPCGHSYCMSCITNCWDQEDQKRVYSCPQCRNSFSPRPALFKNVLFAEMLEKLKTTKLQTAVPAGPGDVQCDICTGRKYKAVKSCLVCLYSYCQTHFERHEEFHPGKRHNVTDATGRLQEMICHKHDKILEVFCRTDQKLICMLCMVDEHRNHNTVSTALQRAEKERYLKDMQQISWQQRIQQREKDLQQLRETVDSHTRSAQTAVDDSERIFTEIICSIERSRSEVTRRIRDQEKTAVSRAEERMERLKQEINDLRRRHAELEQLSHTQDHIQFLQTLQSLSDPLWESTDCTALHTTVASQLSFDDVRETVSKLRKELEDFCKDKIDIISDTVKWIEIIPSPQPENREEFLQYSCQLTLDLNTVNPSLHLSDGNRVISQGDTLYDYPDNPDRFDYWEQVLCAKSVCGRSYWEVERSKNGSVEIAVSYKNICRKGEVERRECLFGYNDHSWSLCFSSRSIYSYSHNSIVTELPVAPTSRRIGVYVDHSAGTLSFYSVSDTMTLIHRVQTTFTQPLYPGFRVYYGTVIKLCDLSI